MITEFLYDFLSNVFATDYVDTFRAMDYLPAVISAMICTIPIALLIRPIFGKKVSNICYIALNIAFFAFSAFSINGGIL